MKSEKVYCEGGLLDGTVQTVLLGQSYFNIVRKGVDYGNGLQDVRSTYQRTERLKQTKDGDLVIFYSDPKWDR